MTGQTKHDEYKPTKSQRSLTMTSSCTTTTTTATTSSTSPFPHNDNSVSICSLPRLPLSIILAFLPEYDATSLLLCRRCWTKHLLPVFRIMPKAATKAANNVDGSRMVSTSTTKLDNNKKKNRHRFMVVPVPDPMTRLDRLNTRRLYEYVRRRRRRRHQHLPTPAEHHPSLLQFYTPALFRHQLFKPGTTVLASYPRSGNTLLRHLIESITGFVTGSDTRPDRPLSMSLANQFGLVGEGVSGPLLSSYFDYPEGNINNNKNTNIPNAVPTTPIVKTHWPERVGWYPYTCHRIILLVRNPWDAIDSYWHLNATNTHTEKVADSVYEDHYKLWVRLIRNEFIVWNDFLSFWDKQSRTHEIPILWIRYEDLIKDQHLELERILEFCCSDDAPTATTDERVDGLNWWKARLINHTASTAGASSSESSTPHEENEGKCKTPCQHSAEQLRQKQRQHGYNHSSSSSALQSVGRMIRKQRYPMDLLKELHSMYASSGDDNDDNDDSEALSDTNYNSKIKKETNWIKVLGYDVFEQGFPNNLDSLPPLPETSLFASLSAAPHSVDLASASDDIMKKKNNNKTKKMKVNEPQSLELRSMDSPFGRRMRDWRRQHTADDTRPFPVAISKSSSTKKCQ